MTPGRRIKAPWARLLVFGALVVATMAVGLVWVSRSQALDLVCRGGYWGIALGVLLFAWAIIRWIRAEKGRFTAFIRTLPPATIALWVARRPRKDRVCRHDTRRVRPSHAHARLLLGSV